MVPSVLKQRPPDVATRTARGAGIVRPVAVLRVLKVHRLPRRDDCVVQQQGPLVAVFVRRHHDYASFWPALTGQTLQAKPLYPSRFRIQNKYCHPHSQLIIAILAPITLALACFPSPDGQVSETQLMRPVPCTATAAMPSLTST